MSLPWIEDRKTFLVSPRQQNILDWCCHVQLSLMKPTSKLTHIIHATVYSFNCIKINFLPAQAMTLFLIFQFTRLQMYTHICTRLIHLSEEGYSQHKYYRVSAGKGDGVVRSKFQVSNILELHQRAFH